MLYSKKQFKLDSKKKKSYKWKLLKKFISKGNTTKFNRGIPFFSVYW